MDLGKALLVIARIEGLKVTSLARMMEVSYQSFYRSVSSGSLRWDRFVKIVEKLGYEVVVRKGDIEFKLGVVDESEDNDA